MNTRKQSIVLWSVVLSVLSISAVAIFVGVFSSRPSATGKQLAVPVASQDHSTGNQSATVTVVVYSDFQCPSCAEFNKDVKALEGSLAKEVRFVYRHFPLPQHPNSPFAAFAAESAGLQGRFDAMKDKLFVTQEQWANLPDAREFFAKLAGELGLDVERFARDMASKSVEDKVIDDFNGGEASRLESTPSVFVNGELMPSGSSVQNVRSKIDETLKTR